MEERTLSRLLSVKEIAQYLGVSIKTIYYWVHRKEVPYIKVGKHLRFDAVRVLAHFEDQTKLRSDSCRGAFGGVDLNSSFRSLKSSGAGSAVSSEKR